MNRNNLNWVDNKVFNNPTGSQNTQYQNTPPARPYADTMPAQHQDTQHSQGPTDVSPSTYQNPTNNTNQSGVSPATYQDMPAKDPTTGVSPMQYQEPPVKAAPPMGVSPAQYQDMPAKAAPQAGVSPAQYQADTSMDLGMMGVPRPSWQQPGMQGTLTRTEAYDASPFMEGPPTVLSAGYTPAYLKTQIGKRVRAEFNIGTNLYMDKTGVMREVGISYFVLEDNVTHAMVMCDLYSLKFLTSIT